MSLLDKFEQEMAGLKSVLKDLIHEVLITKSIKDSLLKQLEELGEKSEGHRPEINELIRKFLKDLDFLEGNKNADWNIKTKIRPKWEKEVRKKKVNKNEN